MHPAVRKVLKRFYPHLSPTTQVRLQALYVLVLESELARKTLKIITRFQNFWHDHIFIPRPPVTVDVSESYARISAHCGETHFDVVFFAPWLTRGGADKSIVQYLCFYAERGYRVLLILTEIADSPWLDRVPARVTVVEAKTFLSGLSPEDCDLVLSRLLLENAPELIHVANSTLGWQILCNHLRALKANGSRLVASLFCDDYDSLGRPHGCAQSFLPSVAFSLDMVTTDSSQYRDTLAHRFDLDRQRITTVHSWTDFPAKETRPSMESTRRILWASRICRQKRPDILLSIAQALPDVTFVICGEVDRPFAPIAARIISLRNVRWHGVFNCFADVAAQSGCTGFLYTSAWDGLPNVLVEAVAAGLPIIAPNVGGIADLCKPETGSLIASPEDVSGYVAAIRELLSNRVEAVRRWQEARNLLEQNHSKRAFDETMDGIIAELGIAPSARELAAMQLAQNRA
jgi:glycosyltransferase involved in cell wall biosynthesis